VQRGELSPRAALHDMLERSVQWRRGVLLRGWVVEASTIDALTFPADLVRAPLAGMGIAVGQYRPKGSPWSRLIIFILAESAQERVATGERQVF
jgi:hypothetical protein